MRDLRRFVLILGGLVGTAGAAALGVAGCGGDDTVASGDSGTADGQGDVTVDTKTDTSHPDAPPDVRVDTGMDSTVDTGMGGDSTPGDSAPTDSAVDSGIDSGVDSGVDTGVVDSGITDASPDYSMALGWPGQVAQAICNRLSACCYPTGDAGAFDMQNCLMQLSTIGYNGSSTGAVYVTTGQVIFDPVAAQNCINDINAIDCAVNMITSAQQQAILTDCFAGYTGTLAAGSACQAAVECTPGNYCDYALGTTAGNCGTLIAQGQPCGNFGLQDPNQAQEGCSYRGSGNTNVTCQFADFTTGTPFPPAMWNCVTDETLGQGCNLNTDCTTKLCDTTTFVCTMAEQFATMGTCTYFLKDGG